MMLYSEFQNAILKILSQTEAKHIYIAKLYAKLKCPVRTPYILVEI